MVTVLEPKPNTFYVKKDLDDDVGVMPLYGDAYIGMDTNYDLVSSPNTTYYIAESTVISPDDYPYGEGNISECHLSFYANSLSTTESQVAPFMDVYSLKPNIDLTEGNLSLFSGSTGTGPISVYSSMYDMGTPWFNEDFDGTNKFFMDAPTRNQPTYTRLQTTDLIIKINDYMKAVFSKHEKTKGKHSGYTWNNLVETTKQGLDYGEYLGTRGGWGIISALTNAAGSTFGAALQTGLASQALIPHTYGGAMMHGGTGIGVTRVGATAAGGFTLAGMGTAAAGVGAAYIASLAQARGQEEISLTKAPDGLFYNVTPQSMKNLDYDNKKLYSYLSEGHTRGWWLARGARQSDAAVSLAGGAGIGEYSSFDETYIAKCDQYNSMFSNVYVRGNARDIKAETVGDTGDNTKFLAYAFCNLVSDDVATDGNALRMKLFWENYSGSGYTDIEGGNYFGWNSTKPSPAGTGHPLPQAIFCTTRGIPQPALYDVTTPSLSSSVAPEMEIRFKIKEMPVAPYVWSGSGIGTQYADDRGRELSRSFSVILHYAPLASSSSDPHITENFADTGLQSGVSTKNGAITPITINFSKMKQGNKIDVLGIVQAADRLYAKPYVPPEGNCNIWDGGSVSGTNGVYLVYPPGTAKATARGLDKYHTQIPEGEWVTMRIKMWTPQNKGYQEPPYGAWEPTDGSNIIAYFPDLKDENGEMQYIQVYNTLPMGPSGIWPSNLTLWTNNMRSINAVPGTYTPANMNNLYTKVDDNPDDDKIMDVLVDNISFFGWGSLTNNATVSAENGMGSLLRMPNATGIPVASANTMISKVGATTLSNGLNYYGDFTHPIASYLSFGYDNTGSGVKEHKLLFNDFFTATPTTVQGIPHLKAGYFTSGNYSSWNGANGGQLGPLGWFTNLTIGASGAGSGHIQTGGDDNFIDNFRQKGLMGVSGAFTGWVRSGNPYVGAKILSVNADGTQITVDKADIFNTSQDERFVIESFGGMDEFTYTTPFAGSGMIGYTHEEFEAGSGSRGYVTPLTQIQAVQGNTVYLNQAVLYDDVDVQLAAPINSESELNTMIRTNNYKAINNNARLIISPYKYWMNIAYVNASQASGSGGVGSISLIVPGSGGYSTHPGQGTFNFAMSGGTGADCVLNANCVGDPGLGVPVSPRGTVNYIVENGTGYTVGDTLYFPGGTGGDPVSVSASCTVEGVQAPWGSWYGAVSGGGAVPLQPRTYNTVVAVSGGSVKGTTFNEFLFNDGLYANPWNLDMTDPENPYINNQIDYGAGVVTAPEEGSPGINLSRGGGMGYIQRDFLLSGQNYLNLSGYIRVGAPQPNDDFNFMVVPSYMMDDDSFYTVNVDTLEGTNKAELIYGIKDLIPQVGDFRVSPVVDLLKQGVDLYNTTKGTATDIRFDWEEEGNDIWYRMLWIDTDNITNKYHKAKFIAPLNEAGTTAYYYRSASHYTSGISRVLGGTNIPDIEGVRGYGTKLSGTTLLSSSNNENLGGTSNFTHSFYLRPTTSGTFFCASGTGDALDRIWEYSISSSKVRIDVGASSSTQATLTSTTTYDLDGIQPLAIVFTYDQTIDNNNFKLYVNGHLEDTSDDTTGVVNWPYRIGIGKHFDGSHPYSGFVQEITLHSKTASIPVNPSSYIHNTKHLEDKNKVYNSRLFIFDYHNINGVARTEVCRSNQTGWKVTAL